MSDKFEKFNLVNQTVKTEEVFDYIGAELVKEGPYILTYKCPYHTDDLPSLNVDLNTGRFNCFACDNKGGGAYGAAKYYLEQQAGTKVGQLAVINFLIQVVPAVEVYKSMFTTYNRADYERGLDKRERFRHMARSNERVHALNNNLLDLPIKDKKNLIDAIMSGMDYEFLATSIIKAPTLTAKKETEVTDEFLALLGTMEEEE